MNSLYNLLIADELGFFSSWTLEDRENFNHIINRFVSMARVDIDINDAKIQEYVFKTYPIKRTLTAKDYNYIKEQVSKFL